MNSNRKRLAVAASAAAALAVSLLASLVVLPPSAAAQDTVIIDDGHVDAVAPRIVDGALQVHLKDGTQSGAPVFREPGTVVTHVTPQARTEVPDDPNYAFLGEPGDDVWIIPQQAGRRRGVGRVEHRIAELGAGRPGLGAVAAGRDLG